MKVVYLDHAATTPMLPEVLDAMYPYFIEHFGNPSSIHRYGRAAQQAIREAREQIATVLGTQPNEIIFTSGGTESNNMAIHHVIQAARFAHSRIHVITSSIEHHAVLRVLQHLESDLMEVTYVPVDAQGVVNVEHIEQAIRSNTVLISVMYGNNEVGTLQPIQAIGELAKERGIPFHVDAVQALGKVKIDLSAMHVDYMSFSAHKIYGPKGIGALYVSSKHKFFPLMIGGSQEKKRRAGTEHVAGIVGFAKAMQGMAEGFDSHVQLLNQLRQSWIEQLHQQLRREDYVIHGHPILTLPHISNVSFPGISSESMIMNLDLQGFAVSSGSACTSGALEISHVLQAMQLPDEWLQSNVRFSFGYGNRQEDIQEAVTCIAGIIRRIQNRL
jgi:cysteine desulfurase